MSQHQSRLLQQSESGSHSLCRSRSKSPRPQTLPGLVKASAENQAENRVTSPQAPLPVKTYAKNLIEGIISDTITRVHSDDADDEDKNNEETDVSLSLASEKETEAAAVGSETAGIS